MENPNSTPKLHQVIDALTRSGIVICPTGTSTQGAGAPGHVGIGGNTHYMSNSSSNGLFNVNYKKGEWETVFAKRGFVSHYFRAL